MTATRRDGLHQSGFLEWIRSVPGLDSRRYLISVTDSDVWIHRFSNRKETFVPGNIGKPLIEHIQLLEIKTFEADVPFAQRDTLSVIDLMLRKATVYNHKRRPISIPDTRFGRSGCKRHARWLGCHLVQLSGDRPDNSDRIIWDGKHQITVDHLIELLRFDRDPDHPERFLDTRRHHRRPFKESLPVLFKDAAE